MFSSQGREIQFFKFVSNFNRPSHKICSKHFSSEQRDLKSELSGDVRRNILIPSAVPTKYPIFDISRQKSKIKEPVFCEVNFKDEDVFVESVKRRIC